jgi:hypothetical protein
MSLDADYFSTVLDTVKAKLEGSGISFVIAPLPEPPSNNWYELTTEKHGQDGSRYVFTRFIPISSLRIRPANELAEQFIQEAIDALGKVTPVK